MRADFSSAGPFEICSIRPPTENNSLTFRLTRHCYWNKCAFCPVYKFGSTFSRRSIEEVVEDVAKAHHLYTLLSEHGLLGYGSLGEAYGKLIDLLGDTFCDEPSPDNTDQLENPNPRLEWFLSWFKDKPSLKDSLEHLLAWHYSGETSCFLGDADSLILKPAFMETAISTIKHHFPVLNRFTIYGRTRIAARSRTLQDLKDYRAAGLHRVHFGLESGSDKVLALINKGENQNDHIEGGLKTKEAGLSCSVYVMPGLGGQDHSGEHALETAKVINLVSPDFVRLRSLQVFPQTPLNDSVAGGEFKELTEAQLIGEIRMMIDAIEAPTQLYSDSAVNLVPVNGRLPDEKADMLATLDRYLSLSEKEQLIYSLESRLGSFVGQYGNLAPDIFRLLRPYVKDQQLDYAMMDEQTLQHSIDLIRSKLMP